MKFKLFLVAALVAVLGLTGCGGGGGGSGSSSSSSSSTAVISPAALSYTDTTVGTGTTVATGMITTITYTGWVYSDTAADHKGTQFDTGTFSFTFGAGQVITGMEQGMAGMKVGGKRTILIPTSLAYGSTGYGTIPANAGVVFEITLTSAQATGTVASPTVLTFTDVVVGTGTVAAASGKSATVTYTGWLYSDTAADHKGAQFDTGTFTYTMGTSAVIAGFEQGMTGMTVGGKRTIYIPSSMGYGSTGSGVIPANSGLVFDVTLTAIQ